jgi:MFS family permease
VRALTAATFLEWLGASAVLPILPLYLARQHASDFVIGLAMAAFFAAGVVVQYPIGRLGDRIGPLKVLVAALGCFAIASLGYLLPVGPIAEIGLRFVQGGGAAAAEVACLSMVGRYVAPGRRGTAYGAIFGAQLAGLAIAPLFGSIVGIDYMSALFVAGAITAAIACAPVLIAARARQRIDAEAALATDPDPAPEPEPGQVRLLKIRALQGAFVVALVAGLTTGIYEACWTLLLNSRGAHSWQIGLSWCLFCVPFVAMSIPAGRLADRLDRRWLVFFSLLASVIMLFVYPFVSSLTAVIALGAAEGFGVAIAYPAAQSLLAELAPPHELGRTQGVFSTLQTAAIAISAALGGALFGSARWLPFVVVGALSAVLLASVPRIWSGVAGRAT